MAKYSSDYTINVLSASLYQYDNPTTQAPASLGPFGPINLRKKCVPYLAGSLTALDRSGMRDLCFPPTYILSQSLIRTGGHLYPPTLVYEQFISPQLITPGSQLYIPAEIMREINMSLISDGGHLYNPSILYDQIISSSLLNPGGQLYEPSTSTSFNILMSLQGAGGRTYTPELIREINMSVIAGGGQLYNPVFFYDQTISSSLLSPGSQLHDPSISLNIPMPLQTAGGQLYNPEIIRERDMLLLAAGAQLYNPTLFYDQTINLSLLNPGGQLYEPSTSTSINIPMSLQSVGSQLYAPEIINQIDMALISAGAQSYNPVINRNIPMSLQTPGSQLYTPEIINQIDVSLVSAGARLYDPTFNLGLGLPYFKDKVGATPFTPTISTTTPTSAGFYTQIVSASNPNNTTAMHVGSVYLDARTYTTFGAMITDIHGGVGGQNVHAELKRFTGGTSLVQLNNTGTAGATWRSVSTSNLVVSNSDWYDIYISASANQSIAFNGTDAESQLTVANNDSLNFGANGTDGGEPSFSWSAWIKPTTLGSDRFYILSKTESGAGDNSYALGWFPWVGLTFFLGPTAGGAGAANYIAKVLQVPNIVVDKWQHIVITYDGSRNVSGMNIYVDGIIAETMAGTGTGTYTNMSNTSNDLVIGRQYADTSTHVADGFLDEIAAFDKELSAAEVLELYNSGEALNLNTFSAASDIVSWWRMGDKATGTSPNYTIPDQIGSNDATMTAFQGDSTSGVVADGVNYPATSSIRGIFYEY